MNRREFLGTGAITAGSSLFPAAMKPAPLQSRPVKVEFHVALNGDDRGPGTVAYPFRSLERARQEVLKHKSRSHGPVAIWVHQGTYYLDASLVFHPEDSGTAEAPVIYAAYKDAEVTISGGRRMDCHWVSYQDGIFRCHLPEVKRNPHLGFTQLFINGKRQIRARYPNYDIENPLVTGKGYIDVADGTEPWPDTQFHFDPATFTRKRWAHPEEAVVHLFPLDYWGNLQWQVRDVDWKAHLIRLGWGGFQINQALFGEAATGIGKSRLYHAGYRSRFFVENVFEELDSPGEWYLDRRRGDLYAIPEAGVDLESALIEAPLLSAAIEFRGSQRQPVHDIHLSGFRIAHTESTFLKRYEAPSRGDWTIHRKGAVFLEGTKNCAIERCFFDAVGGNAVFLNQYNLGSRVYGNRITESGDSAICLVGFGAEIQGTSRPIPEKNLISNNLIHDCGYFGKQIAGIFLSFSERNTISHNLIYNMPRAAICVNDGWGGGHVIEFNHIHDTVRETHDHGPFNSWGRGRFWCMEQSHGKASHRSGYHDGDPGYVFFYPEADSSTTIIRNNLLREPQSVHQLGIDLDDGSSHYYIYKNICSGIAINMRDGDVRTIENNIFFHPANPPSFHQGNEGNRDRFIRNIVVTSWADNLSFGKSSVPGDSYQIANPPLRGRILAEADYNLFFNDLEQFFASITPRGGTRSHYTLQQWQALGYDRHSIYADPMFTDPDGGNFQLKAGSPALTLGFKQIDVSRIGLLPDFPKRWLDR